MKKAIISILLILSLLFIYTPQTYAASKVSKVSGVSQIGADTGSVTIGWNKAKGAKKYKVYVSTKSSKKNFKCKKTTSNTSATITGFKKGQKIWVKVRGIKGKKKGSYSKVVKMYAGTGQTTQVQPQETYSPYTIVFSKGSPVTIMLPSGYNKSFENATNVTFKSSSLPLKFVNAMVSESGYLDKIKSTLATTPKTYNGIEGYEYTNGNNVRSFTFISGSYEYTIQVEGKDCEALLQRVLSGLAI